MKRLHDCNLDLRLIARSRGVSHTELAKELGVPPDRLARWFHREMSTKQNNKVLTAILEIARKRGGAEHGGEETKTLF